MWFVLFCFVLFVCLFSFLTDLFVGSLFLSPHLDKSGDKGWALGFAVFGVVVEGMDVAGSRTCVLCCLAERFNYLFIFCNHNTDKISKLETETKGGLKMLKTPVVFESVTISNK